MDLQASHVDLHASLCRIVRQMLDADILTNGKNGSVSSSTQGKLCCGSLPIRESVYLQTLLLHHPLIVEKQEVAPQR